MGVKKYTLTIVIAGIEQKNFVQCVDCLFDAHIPEKTQLLIFHRWDSGWLREYLSQKKNENITVRSKYMQNIFSYPKVAFREFHLKRLWKGWATKKIEPFRFDEKQYVRRAWIKANQVVRGKYLMLLPEELRLKPDFWKNSIALLLQKPQIYTLVGSVDRIGEGLPYSETALLTGMKCYSAGEGIASFLHSAGFKQYVCVVSTKQIQPVWMRLLMPDEECDDFLLDRSVTRRMWARDSILQGEFLAESDISEQELKRFFDLSLPISRYISIKALCRGSVFYKKYDKILLFQAYEQSRKDFPYWLEQLEDYYIRSGQRQTAKRYTCLKEAIGRETALNTSCFSNREGSC